MSILQPPPDVSKPLFVYGLLKPRELAFGIVEGFTIRAEPSDMHGVLQLRDGIPLLDPGANGTLVGWLLWFEASRLDAAA